MVSSTTTLLPSDEYEADILSSIYHEIIEHHILSRLDVRSVASLSCTSSHFYALLSKDWVWRNICLSTWPSVAHPRVLQQVSSMPGGFRSFFSDSYPALTAGDQVRKLNWPIQQSELISAVDIWYKNQVIFSRVLETETGSESFLDSSFGLDLFASKEGIPTHIKLPTWDEDEDNDNDPWQKELEENFTLSWIIIDPISNRCANFSSVTPASVDRHWPTNEISIKYATILKSDTVGLVECKVVLVCGGWLEGELQLTQARLQLEDMDRRYLNGRDSLVTLLNAVRLGKRGGKRGEEKKRHQEFCSVKRLKRDRKFSRERLVEMACIAGISIFVAFSTSFLI